MDLKKRLVALMFIALFGTGAANAAMVTVDVTGTISQINSNDIFGAGVGDTWMLSYSYDTDTAVDTNSDGNVGLYFLGTPMSFTLGGVTYTSPDSISAVQLVNDTAGVDGYISGTAGTFSANGLDNLSGLIMLTDTDASVFGDDSLPLSFALSDFENTMFNFGGSAAGVFGGVLGSIDSITFSSDVSPVPIPGAIWLFGSALAGLFGFKLRQRTTGILPA